MVGSRFVVDSWPAIVRARAARAYVLSVRKPALDEERAEIRPR